MQCLECGMLDVDPLSHRHDRKHDLVRGVIVICKLCRRAEPELDSSCIPLPLDKQMTAAEIKWVESSLPIPGIPTQPTPETGGEWRVFEHYRNAAGERTRILDASGVLVAEAQTEAGANQIITDHRAMPLLVTALKDALSGKTKIRKAEATLAAVGREEER